MTSSAPSWSWKNPRDLFQAVSYLQYPFMVVALVYCAKPLFTGMDGVLDDYNRALLYAGIGIGLSSLQDPTRMQNEVSRRVWQDPRKGRAMLWLLAGMSFAAITFGLVGANLAPSRALGEVAMGMLSLGLGFLGLLRTALEMAEHHRVVPSAEAPTPATTAASPGTPPRP